MPGSETRYIPLESIVFEYVEELFSPYTVLEKVIFCVTRNGDVNPDDEVFADEFDFRKRMKKVLKQRKRLAPVRLELSHSVSYKFLAYFQEKLGPSPSQIYITKAPLNMKYVYGLLSKIPKAKQAALSYPKFTPAWPATVKQENILKQVEKRISCFPSPLKAWSLFCR